MIPPPPPTDPPLNLRNLTKETRMQPDHDNPANAAVKPGLKTSEGQIALIVVVVTALGPLVAMLAEKFPDDWRAQIAVAVLASITLTLTTLGYFKGRGEVKQTANVAAASLVLADKAIAVAKDHPELAAKLLESAGVGGPSDPASRR